MWVIGILVGFEVTTEIFEETWANVHAGDFLGHPGGRLWFGGRSNGEHRASGGSAD
jgi:hypothetical protein